MERKTKEISPMQMSASKSSIKSASLFDADIRIGGISVVFFSIVSLLSFSFRLHHTICSAKKPSEYGTYGIDLNAALDNTFM